METHKTALFDLFRRERQYRVPLFQRPYVWSEETQWEPLWNDIADRAQTVMEASERRRSVPPVRNHFLGAIVTQRLDVFGAQIDAAEVIDGQQRLTTLQVVLAAFRDFLQTLSEEDATALARVASDLATLTKNAGVMAAETEVFKIWPTNVDRKVFEQVLTSGNVAEVKERFPLVRRKYQRIPDPRPRLAEAYLYFHERVAEFCTSVEEPVVSDIQKRVHALYEALRRHILLVHIELQDDDDPQVIFESLNARGEPLLPSDLIRNFVFMRAGAQKIDANGLYDKRWKEYDERRDPEQKGGEGRFWKQMDRQGRIHRPRLDLFIYHYLQSMLSEEVGIGHLYKTFRGWWEGSPDERDVEEELARMRTHSDVFARLAVPGNDGAVEAFARRLKVLDTSTIYPVLLLLLAARKDRVADGDLEGILQDLESYLIRRLVCGLTTKSYNKFFLSLLRRLREADVITRSLVQEHLLEGTGPAVVWPDDTAFSRAWLSRPIYADIKSHRVEMILSVINARLHSAKQEPVTFEGKLTVEHVLPVAWAAPAWPDPPSHPNPEDGEETAEELRNRLLHTFGNLTLLTQELNSSVSNGPYGEKKPEITEQSLIRLNAWFQREAEWNETKIQERGKALLNPAKDVWPRPRPAEATAEADSEC